MRETGLSTFDDAFTKIAGSRSAQAAETEFDMVARATRGDGRRLTSTDVREQHFRAMSSQNLMAVQMADEERAKAENRRSTLAVQGAGMPQLRRETESARDPVGVAMQESNRLAMMQLEELRRIAAIESPILRTADDAMSRVGFGEGSHRAAYERRAKMLSTGGSD
jgi:hypothetical protein